MASAALGPPEQEKNFGCCLRGPLFGKRPSEARARHFRRAAGNLNLEVRQKIWISTLGLKDERWIPGRNAPHRRRISGIRVWGALWP